MLLKKKGYKVSRFCDYISMCMEIFGTICGIRQFCLYFEGKWDDNF